MEQSVGTVRECEAGGGRLWQGEEQPSCPPREDPLVHCAWGKPNVGGSARCGVRVGAPAEFGGAPKGAPMGGLTTKKAARLLELSPC